MKIKSLAVLSVCFWFVAACFSTAHAAQARQSLAAAQEAFPSIISGQGYDLFPIAVHNVNGLDSLLIVSNLETVNGAFEVCSLLVGAVRRTCVAEGYGPLESKFIDLPSIGITNTFGQIAVFQQGQTFGASGLLIFDTIKGGFTFVQPVQVFVAP